MRYLHDQRESLLELVSELVLIESPSTEPASQAAILARLGTEFERLDYRVIRLPGRTSGGHLYATPRRRARRSASSRTASW